jgi:hypothetical protein
MLPVQIERPEDFAWCFFDGSFFFLLDFLRAMRIFHVSRGPSRRRAGFVKRAGEPWAGDCAFGMALLLSA